MDEINQLSEIFKLCQKTLQAIGDENRQHMILMMLSMKECKGVRVGAIAQKTNLSRTAVSKHLRTLMEVGIVKVRKEGTKNYYYFYAEDNVLDNLIEMFTLSKKIMKELPDRKGK